MTSFLTIFRRFPTTFRRFPKLFQNCSEGQTNLPEHFPKISEDVRRLLKTFEEDPKMFRWYTSEFKYNLRDKLDSAIFVWPWKTESLCDKLFHLPVVFELRTHFPLRSRDVAPNMETALFGRPIKNLWNGWRSLKARSDLKHRWNEDERERLSWMCDFLVVFRKQSLII